MSFQCATAPNVVFKSREELHEHYKSDWHRYNLRRRAAGLAPINKDVFDKVREVSKQKSSETKVKKQDHIKNHRKDEEEEEEEDDEEEEESKELSSKSTTILPSLKKQEDLQEKVAKAIREYEANPNRCIWDGLVSNTIEDNLGHMHREHGFVIHDLESCINLPGLVNYLSEKVHVGRICLFCEKEFRSSAACISHMTSKGHCRIGWEYEDQIEEFLEFYDFSSLEQEANKNDGNTMEFDSETGEIILKNSDGSVKRLGPSREYRNVYRTVKEEQRHHQTENPAYANAVKERSLQIYQRAGVLTTTSTALQAVMLKRINKRANEIQDRAERKFHNLTIKNGMQVNLLIKDRKAGTNVGAGHGVHG